MNRSFTTVSERSDRTVLVAEAFGLGLDSQRQFSVLDSFGVDVRPDDVCYITGDSGGGKSTLLRMLVEATRKSGIFGKVLDDRSINVSEDEVLIHGAGATFEEALRNLSLAGLNDAFLFIRRYGELSDGQRYRYRVAKMLASDASVWVFDEFLSILDRETARAVAYCLQSIARKERKTLLVATTHDDLIEELNPSIIIRKGFGSDVEVKYPKPVPYSQHRCSLTRDIEIKEGSKEDYERLSEFHYRSGLPSTTKHIFTMYHRGKVVGVIAYKVSPFNAAGRSKFLGYAPSLQEVNRDFLTICRVVLHPKFRGIGLGAKIVRETLPLVNRKHVEAIAVMARFNPFFEKAGMTKVQVKSSMPAEANAVFEKVMKATGDHVSRSNFGSISELDEDTFSKLVDVLSEATPYFVLNNIYGHRTTVKKDGLREDLKTRAFAVRVLSELASMAQEKAYYIWRNPAL